VAAGGGFWAAWRACGRAAEQLGWRWGASKRHVEAAQVGGGAGMALHGDGGAAQRRRRGAEEGSRLEVEERTKLQFPKFPGTKL